MKYKIKPLKQLGQNFLIDKSIVKKIIRIANLRSKDIVLEIGPGLGALTKELAKPLTFSGKKVRGEKVKKVIAVEKDTKMCETLQETFKGFKNLKIINADILRYKLQVTGYKVVANLPFYITAPVIRKFLESDNPPKEMVLIVQKEVAQRICAKPPKMSILAVSVQFYAKPEIIFYVSKKSFWPQPKVDGAIIKIIPQKKNKINANLFFKIVKAGFSHPRKQLANNLAKMLKLDKPLTFSGKKVRGKQDINDLLLKNNIQPTQRAETLSINDWLKLSKMLK